ncbi:MAG: protease complex subunit PrcB family protein [Tyzzerella sp.]|nr:protease complex subunit PrcB family protein [Tyzzerella sp.]
MKKLILAILCIIGLCSAGGCSVETVSSKKLQDIDFTVVEEEDIPEEFLAIIQEKETSPFKLTYADQGALYIAEGYGEQETSGYSIEVKECYETENAVYVHTNLIGPAKDEKIVEAATYPYIVIKLEFIDKNVVFQ